MRRTVCETIQTALIEAVADHPTPHRSQQRGKGERGSEGGGGGGRGKGGGACACAWSIQLSSEPAGKSGADMGDEHAT